MGRPALDVHRPAAGGLPENEAAGAHICPRGSQARCGRDLTSGKHAAEEPLRAAGLWLPLAHSLPGKALAREINQQWHQEHEQPYPLVGGDWWLAGNVACYAAHRPSVYPSRELWLCEPEPRAASWTSDEDFQQRGGVLLWNAQGQETICLNDCAQRFPAAEVKPPLLLPYECSAPLPPLRVGVAFVTPHSLTSRERGITRSPGIERDEGKD